MPQLQPPVSAHDQQTHPAKAAVTLVEYGDYQCPYCGQAYPFTKQLQQEFREQLDFVFRNFPLTEEHPMAQPAALAAEAAGLQSQFWPMHDMIYEHQAQLQPASFTDFARQLKLDPVRFAADLKSPAVTAKVQSDFEGGVRSGVNGTPSFFLNGERLDSYDGTYESLQQAVAEHVPPRR